MKRTLFLCLGALTAFSIQPALAQKPAAATATAAQSMTPETLTQQQIHSVKDPTTLYRMAAHYQQANDMRRVSWTLEQLARVVPLSGEIKLAMAAAYSNLDEKSKAYDVLVRMQQQGYGYNLIDDPRFKQISDTQVWEYAAANLRANLKSFGEGKIAFALPKGQYLFESMAWDAKRQRFLFGSVREGKIYLSDKSGKLEEFISPNAENGMWSAYALAVDAPRDLLYVTSTASAFFKDFKAESFGQAGVFKFQLSTGKFLDKVVLPKPANDANTLSSIAVSKSGQVYVADGLRNIIYRLDGKSLKPIMQHPDLTSVRGMAISDDNKSLYFADYTSGLFGIDLSTGKPFDVKYEAAALVLPGIESVFFYQNTLVVIQPGMSPKRVMRLHLAADGRSIERVMPLDAGNPSFPLPTNGSMVGDELYFLADSHKNFYDQYGVAKNEYADSPQHVFRSNLRFEWDRTLAGPKLGDAKANAPQMVGDKPALRRDLLEKSVEDFGRSPPTKKPGEPVKKD